MQLICAWSMAASVAMAAFRVLPYNIMVSFPVSAGGLVVSVNIINNVHV